MAELNLDILLGTDPVSIEDDTILETNPHDIAGVTLHILGQGSAEILEQAGFAALLKLSGEVCRRIQEAGMAERSNDVVNARAICMAAMSLFNRALEVHARAVRESLTVLEREGSDAPLENMLRLERQFPRTLTEGYIRTLRTHQQYMTELLKEFQEWFGEQK